MTTVAEEKQSIREKLLRQRMALSNRQWETQSRAMGDLFFAELDLNVIQTLHIFLPLTKKKEPNTHYIIDRVRMKFSHVRIVVPRVNAEDVMEAVVYGSPEAVVQNQWGIAEPIGDALVDPAAIDVVAAPLLACDVRGMRIGYGRGYYDRFLATCRADCLRVGLSFFVPLRHVPAASWDKPLHQCITPHGIYRFHAP